MQLVLVAHRGGTALQVGDVGIVVGNDEGTLKLPCVAGIDAEIAAQFHRTAHAFGDVDERPVGEYGRVEGGKVVVAIGHDGAQVLAHQIAMLLDGITDGTEDDALLSQFFLKSGFDADRVHDGVDGSIATQGQAFLQGNA